jgi:hypothetical protein
MSTDVCLRCGATENLREDPEHSGLFFCASCVEAIGDLMRLIDGEDVGDPLAAAEDDS